MTAALPNEYENCLWVTYLANPRRIRILIPPDAPDNALVQAIHVSVPSGEMQQWDVSPGMEQTSGWDEWIIERV